MATTTNDNANGSNDMDGADRFDGLSPDDEGYCWARQRLGSPCEGCPHINECWPIDPVTGKYVGA